MNYVISIGYVSRGRTLEHPDVWVGEAEEDQPVTNTIRRGDGETFNGTPPRHNGVFDDPRKLEEAASADLGHPVKLVRNASDELVLRRK